MPPFPATTFASRNLRMAFFAEGHQIAFHMGAALGERENMMYFLGWCQFSVLLALFAQWVGRDISITNPFPCAAIATLAGWITFMSVIVRRNNFLVFLAISPVSQSRTAGIGAGALWFVWHSCRLLSGHKESPRRFLREGSPLVQYFMLPV